MMNLLIGILGANYDRFEELARAHFVRERAIIITQLATRPWHRCSGRHRRLEPSARKKEKEKDKKKKRHTCILRDFSACIPVFSGRFLYFSRCASDARAVVCRSRFRDFFAFFVIFRDFSRFFARARASLALATLALARASRIAKNTGVQND